MVPLPIRTRDVNGIAKGREADNEEDKEEECAENSNKENTPLLRLCKNRRVSAPKRDASLRASC